MSQARKFITYPLEQLYKTELRKHRNLSWHEGRYRVPAEEDFREAKSFE